MAKVAAIQMCSTDNVLENLDTVAGLIEQAAAEGALLAVLPEMFAFLGTNEFSKLAIKEMPGSGTIQNFISSLAFKHKIWIVAGTIPMLCENPNKVRAACIVFNAQGEAVARYDKIHLFDVVISEKETYQESDTIEPGQETVVVSTPIGKLGLCVCYDLRFPAIFSELLAKGAEIIVAPSAFTYTTGKAHWELLNRSRAIDTFSYVIGACQGGKHKNGRQTYGHAMIVDPWGEVLASLDMPGNNIIYAGIDRERVYAIRKKMGVYAPSL